MSEFLSERRQMNAAAVSQRRVEMRDLLHRIAGPGGLVKARIRLAAKALGWSYSRTKDLWYADPRSRVDRPEILQAREIARVHVPASVETDLERLRSLEDEVAELRHLLAATLHRMEGEAADPAQHHGAGSGEGAGGQVETESLRHRPVAGRPVGARPPRSGGRA